MDPIIESPSVVVADPPDELEAFQLELVGFIRDVLDFHCRGRSLGEARFILTKLSALFREEMARHEQ